MQDRIKRWFPGAIFLAVFLVIAGCGSDGKDGKNGQDGMDADPAVTDDLQDQSPATCRASQVCQEAASSFPPPWPDSTIQ